MSCGARNWYRFVFLLDAIFVAKINCFLTTYVLHDLFASSGSAGLCAYRPLAHAPIGASEAIQREAAICKRQKEDIQELQMEKQDLCSR